MRLQARHLPTVSQQSAYGSPPHSVLPGCPNLSINTTPLRTKRDMKKKVVVAFSGGLDTSYTVMYLAKEK